MLAWFSFVFVHTLCRQYLCSFKEEVEWEKYGEVTLITASDVNTISSSALPFLPRGTELLPEIKGS